ncbi:hypothetical protein L3X38_040404 [Prunus dulcis]|uniref:CYTH domain-containing protein n=1 Tax=Prunus dulcis TaxID=3755 RepID=A0AAD4VA87_PRUDU|nr:hypothetical protein L3X38_040404 [Prunus dulcis]
MEVEVKLRLPDAAAHRKVTTLLAPFHVSTHRQENFFFDGPKAELSARRAALRLRFSDRAPLCAVTLKARAVLVDGVSRVEEDEEELDHSIGRACADQPDKLMSAESRVLSKVREEFGVLGFVGLGGFRNVRDVYDWKGLKLEVDETNIPTRKHQSLRFFGLASCPLVSECGAQLEPLPSGRNAVMKEARMKVRTPRDQ